MESLKCKKNHKKLGVPFKININEQHTDYSLSNCCLYNVKFALMSSSSSGS